VVPPGLQDDPDPGPPLFVGVVGVGGQDGHHARGPFPEAFEDLDRGGLAAPFGPSRTSTSPLRTRMSTPLRTSLVPYRNPQPDSLDNFWVSGFF